MGIAGPRQSGKSTMLKHLLAKKYRYVTFDDVRMRNLFQDDPEAFMIQNNDHVIIDEVQKAPDIMDYIKREVDADRSRYGKFVLTGSSQFLMMKQISESLAGRIGILSLLPFEYSEAPARSHGVIAWRGSYPELVMRDYDYAEEWYDAYIDTYLTKDVRDFANILDIREFRRFVQMLAGSTSQLLNLSRYATELGVAVSTIRRWIGLLEQSFIIFLLQPYHRNTGKRMVKSPKVYFIDTGLVCSLTGIRTEEMFRKGPMCGAIFENYVISEMRKKYSHVGKRVDFSFYRTSHGQEVDIIVEADNKRFCAEIKSSSTFKPGMFDAIRRLPPDLSEIAYLIYQGESLQSAPERQVVNYADFLEKRIT